MKLALIMSLVAAGSAFAAEPGWPSDFWTTFSNRVTTARAENVTTQSAAATIGAPVKSDAAIGSVGTADAPFDSRSYSVLEALGLNINTYPRTGTIVIFK